MKKVPKKKPQLAREATESEGEQSESQQGDSPPPFSPVEANFGQNLVYETNYPIEQPIPIEFFKIARKIKCLPLLKPKLIDDKLKKIKRKRRDIRRTARRLIR